MNKSIITNQLLSVSLSVSQGQLSPSGEGNAEGYSTAIVLTAWLPSKSPNKPGR